MQSASCKMSDWMKHILQSRKLGEISINSDMQIPPPLWQKVKRNERASWWRWKRRVEYLAGKCLSSQSYGFFRTRPSFPLSQFLPSRSFHKPLILFHQKADRLKTTVTENEQIWSLGPQPCLTQWNYEPCRVGPPKTNRSWWRILTKLGPLEKGMENHWVFLPWEPHEQYEKAKR